MPPQTTGTTASDRTAPGRRPPWWVWVALGAAVVLVVVVAVVALTQRGTTVTQEQTAAENRAAMIALLEESAAAGGVVVEPDTDEAYPRTCTRNDGADGTFFELPDLQGPPVPDVPAFLSQVREHWEGRGYTVTDRSIGEARGLSTTTTEGAVLRVLTGPGGTVLSGQTLCALDAGTVG